MRVVSAVTGVTDRDDQILKREAERRGLTEAELLNEAFREGVEIALERIEEREAKARPARRADP